jgi:hypothetical protein
LRLLYLWHNPIRHLSQHGGVSYQSYLQFLSTRYGRDPVLIALLLFSQRRDEASAVTAVPLDYQLILSLFRNGWALPRWQFLQSVDGSTIFAFSAIGAIEGFFYFDVVLTGRVYHRSLDLSEGEHSMRWFSMMRRLETAKELSAESLWILFNRQRSARINNPLCLHNQSCLGSGGKRQYHGIS